MCIVNKSVNFVYVIDWGHPHPHRELVDRHARCADCSYIFKL